MILVAAEPVPPQVPETCPTPPKVRELAGWVSPVPKLAIVLTAIDRFPLIVVFAVNVLANPPPPERTRLLYVKTAIFWAAVPE